MEVLQSFVENPHTSTRKAALEHNIHYSSVHKILKREKWHPFKLQLTQKLIESNFGSRIGFCDEMMHLYDGDRTFFDRIVFSDEATFQLTGEVNTQNIRYWTDENPRWMREDHTQYPQKLNVWAGFCSRGIVGPFVINGNLNGETYLQLLRNEVVPAIANLFEHNLADVWFQQDGAPPHNTNLVRNFLNEAFENRWIGYRRPNAEIPRLAWPSRSPDLTPLDYFLWGYLKGKVYATKPSNLEELRNRIVGQVNYITPEMRRNVLNNFYQRLCDCQMAEGKQFEHLIK